MAPETVAESVVGVRAAAPPGAGRGGRRYRWPVRRGDRKAVAVVVTDCRMHSVRDSGSQTKKASAMAGLFGDRNGGAEEDRTPDLRIANATLSQLSYRPT